MFPGQIPGLLGDGSLSGLMDRFKDLDLGQLTDLMGGQQEQQQPQMMPIPAPPPIPPQRQETGSIAEAAERPSGTIPLSQEDVFPSGVSEYLQMLLAQQQSAPMRFGSVTRRTV